MYRVVIRFLFWRILPKVPIAMQLFSIGLYVLGILMEAAMEYPGLYFGKKAD